MIHNNQVKAKASHGSPGAKYCTLYVRNEGMPTMHFEVRVTLNGVLIDQFKTKFLHQLSRFFAKYEIYSKDIQEALDIFESHGHNVIQFGMFGSPVGSSFEGSLH